MVFPSGAIVHSLIRSKASNRAENSPNSQREGIDRFASACNSRSLFLQEFTGTGLHRLAASEGVW